MKTRTLHPSIDRIVVEGLSATGQRQFASALEGQLHAMVESGVADQFTGKMRKRISALNVSELRSGATAAEAAEQVTTSIREAIGYSLHRDVPSGQRTSRGRETRRDG